MNRKNIMLVIIGVFFVFIIITILMINGSSGPNLHQKTDLMLNINNSVAYLDIFMLTNITLDEKYFFDNEHLPIILVEVYIPNENAWIIWHVAKISVPEIQELIMSGEGFSKYIIKNGGNGNLIQEEVPITEQGDYTVVFRQTNIEVGTQPYNSKISIKYWVLE